MKWQQLSLIITAVGAVLCGAVSIAAGHDSLGLVLAFLGVIGQQAGTHAIASDTNAATRQLANGELTGKIKQAFAEAINERTIVEQPFRPTAGPASPASATPATPAPSGLSSEQFGQ